MSLTKTASPASGVVPGDTVTYSFSGTNTGVVTLHNVAVTDPMAGLGPIGCSPPHRRPSPPEPRSDCTATYTVTQADVDAGSFSNTATIAGLDPTDAPVDTTATATVTAIQTPGLTVDKTATPATGVHAGDVVTYTIDVHNTGTVTLHGRRRERPDGRAVAARVQPRPRLRRSRRVRPSSCTATYTVTQADVNAGGFSNTATVDRPRPE